tara:strand:+ start:432 stop:653 length:222 start_codon:yes stop_codon:yes gene_type:complete
LAKYTIYSDEGNKIAFGTGNFSKSKILLINTEGYLIYTYEKNLKNYKIPGHYNPIVIANFHDWWLNHKKQRPE